MACNKYYLILYSCAILQHKNSKFLYPWALQNWPVFKRNIMKKFWLKFRNHAKFRAKKLFISNECAISCKTGFVLIRKWCGILCKKFISCKTMQLLRKRIDCFVETLNLLHRLHFLCPPPRSSYVHIQSYYPARTILYFWFKQN